MFRQRSPVRQEKRRPQAEAARTQERELSPIPADISAHSQKEREPPEGENSPHPSFVVGQAESLGQDLCAGSQHQIQSSDFRNASECRVRSGQCVERFIKFRRDPWANSLSKRRGHHQQDDRKIQQHHSGLAPGVPPIPPHPSQQRADQQEHSHGDLEQQDQIGAEGSCGSRNPSVISRPSQATAVITARAVIYSRAARRYFNSRCGGCKDSPKE